MQFHFLSILPSLKSGRHILTGSAYHLQKYANRPCFRCAVSRLRHTFFSFIITYPLFFLNLFFLPFSSLSVLRFIIICLTICRTVCLAVYPTICLTACLTVCHPFPLHLSHSLSPFALPFVSLSASPFALPFVSAALSVLPFVTLYLTICLTACPASRQPPLPHLPKAPAICSLHSKSIIPKFFPAANCIA